MSKSPQKHWLIRIKDGCNFNNSKKMIWSVKRGSGGCIKTIVEKINPGDMVEGF